MYKLIFFIPYYNHPVKIASLVESLKKFGYEILIINDGSDEKSSKILNNLTDVKIINKIQNEGKGAAIKSAFTYALQNKISHIFQIDADFQHDLSEVLEFIKTSKQNPNNFICGYPVYDENIPKSRLYGRKITNFWAKINSLNLDIKDAMCGFRIYPVNVLEKAVKKSTTNKMEFDIEILVNALREKVKISWLKVAVLYEKDGISHFKMVKDNFLISKMHAKMFFSLPKQILKAIYG